MARPKKQTVDYFPHIAANGKTMFILESQFGNDGYAFWFKLLEMIATTDGHVINCRNSADWQFLLAKTRVDEVTASRILDLLSELDAIDRELWDLKVIWCQNFVNNVADVYKNRKTKAPEKPDKNSFYEDKPQQAIVSTSRNSGEQELSVQTTNENPQSKVKETKVKETKVNNSSKEEIPATTTQPNAHDFYQNNFGIENPTVMQTIEMWIEDLNQELVIEAMRRAAIDQKGFRYAEGIMKNWDKKNIRNMEQVEAEDVAFANQSKKKTSYSKQPVRKEVLPDWAKNDYKKPEEKPASAEDQQAFKDRLEKIRSKKKVEEK